MNSKTGFLVGAAALLAAGCTTPLYYAVGPAPGAAPGAWTQSSGASPAAGRGGVPSAGWSSAASAWPEGPAPDLYAAKSLDDLAWESELQADSYPGTLQDGGPTMPTRAQIEQEAYGAPPRVTLQTGGARIVKPGSTGTGNFGANSTANQPAQGAPSALRNGPDGGALTSELPGRTSVMDMNNREIASEENGRPYLFELFQESRDERDRLRVENEELLNQIVSLQGALTELRESTAGAGSELERAVVERDSLRDEIEQLQVEKEELEARLLTAQIRRLEAEKGLLEQWIQGELDQAAAGLSATAASEPETGSEGTP